MIDKITNIVPSYVIRLIGRLQFKVPWVSPIIKFASNRLATGEVTIQRGVGAGLRFDVTNGFPGYYLGTTEPEEQSLLQNLIVPGDTFYDIGAHTGFYSTIAGRLVGSTGHVYAFEPFSESASIARKNAQINNFDHIHVIERAVSGETGSAKLSIRSDSARNTTTQTENRISQVEVSTTTIDNFIAQESPPAPDIVMIDVEGAEMDVLSGMEDTIRNFKPTIMCEVHWIHQEFHYFCSQFLEPLDYIITKYDGDVIPSQAERYHALLLSPNHTDRLADE